MVRTERATVVQRAHRIGSEGNLASSLYRFSHPRYPIEDKIVWGQRFVCLPKDFAKSVGAFDELRDRVIEALGAHRVQLVQETNAEEDKRTYRVGARIRALSTVNSNFVGEGPAIEAMQVISGIVGDDQDARGCLLATVGIDLENKKSPFVILK